MKRHTLLLFFSLFTLTVFAQTGTLTGRVVDEGNLPLP